MRPSGAFADPLTADMICATIRRMGLLSHDEPFGCEPLCGGVSSDIWHITVADRQYCLKRALPRLKVAQLWEAPVARNSFEWQWFRAAGAICPHCVPKLVAHDERAGLFVMEYLDPESYPVWKNQLRDGVVDPQTAERVARRLARIHGATSDSEQVRGQFATDDAFHAIRLEPYLVATSRIHSDLAAPLHSLMQVTASTKRALVHGDISPKNILVGAGGPIFVDAECAWYGDPAFDAAFCLNHLLLKCLWRPQHAKAFLACFDQLAVTYIRGVSWEPRAEIESRIARLLPALLLARIDGKSPIEYITSERDRGRVRDVARPLIRSPRDSVADIRRIWAREAACP
jgi:aminoglycoside phosphotransferase (APT) family kinase protein